MTEDNYGRGRFFILNVPENFADLYKLPSAVIMSIAKHISLGQEVYVAAEPKLGLYAYDNNRYTVVSYLDISNKVKIIVRGKIRESKILTVGIYISSPDLFSLKY